MNKEKNRIVKYSILDPTGNITALVRTEADAAERPFIAGRIMMRHPEVEQVGFVQMEQPGGGEDCPIPALFMAGGEFCGNASMSAAALCHMENRSGCRSGSVAEDKEEGRSTGQPVTVFLRVSGVREPVEVRLKEEGPGSYQGSILMPPARELFHRSFSYGKIREVLPVVRMQGISHIIIDDSQAFFGLADQAAGAEEAVRTWCEQLSVEGLGLMFLERDKAACRLTPLVYIPGSDTVYWENSCASGTSAVGMYLARTEQKSVDLTMTEPGGMLRVESDPFSDKTWLHGHLRLVKNPEMILR